MKITLLLAAILFSTCIAYSNDTICINTDYINDITDMNLVCVDDDYKQQSINNDNNDNIGKIIARYIFNAMIMIALSPFIALIGFIIGSIILFMISILMKIGLYVVCISMYILMIMIVISPAFMLLYIIVHL